MEYLTLDDTDCTFDIHVCRSCGCSDDNACIDEEGVPCYWVEEDLCSECSIDKYV